MILKNAKGKIFMQLFKESIGEKIRTYRYI